MWSNEEFLVGSTIHEVAHLISERIDEEVRPTGLTRLSLLAAAHLAETPGQSVTELAARLEVGNATTGKLVDRMVDAGWLDRAMSYTDRRTMVITPTAKTNAMLKQLAPLRAKLRKAILQDLTKSEREMLEILLNKIKVRLIQWPN